MAPEDFVVLKHRQPFREFRITVKDGHAYEVVRSDFVMIGDDKIFIGLPQKGKDQPIAKKIVGIRYTEVTKVELVGVDKTAYAKRKLAAKKSGWRRILQRFHSVMWPVLSRKVDLSRPLEEFSAEPTPLQKDKQLNRDYRRVMLEMAAYFLKGSGKDRDQVRKILADYPSVASCIPFGQDDLKYDGDTDTYALGLTYWTMTSELQQDWRDTQIFQREWWKYAVDVGIDTESVSDRLADAFSESHIPLPE